VSTPYSATREASKSDRNNSYNWGGTAHRRPHTSFLCEDFFYGEEKIMEIKRWRRLVKLYWKWH